MRGRLASGVQGKVGREGAREFALVAAQRHGAYHAIMAQLNAPMAPHNAITHHAIMARLNAPMARLNAPMAPIMPSWHDLTPPCLPPPARLPPPPPPPRQYLCDTLKSPLSCPRMDLYNVDSGRLVAGFGYNGTWATWGEGAAEGGLKHKPAQTKPKPTKKSRGAAVHANGLCGNMELRGGGMRGKGGAA